MIESSVNTGWKIEEGSLVDEDIALRGSEGLNFVYKIGSTPPDKILPTALPESNFMLINQLRESIEISSAVKRPLDGPDNESNSGIMSMIRQDAADVPLQKYWDSLDRTTKREAKLIMMMTSKNWTEHKFSQILGVPVEECLDLMNVEIQEFSMVVAEGIYTDVQKRADFINLTEVAAIIGIKPSARLLLSKAPITCTDELLADMEQQEAAAREGQEQKSALELALVQAEIKKINAQALEQLNMAGSHHARAGSYAGLENERNAEVAKNESVSNKNNVESLLKLLPLIEQYGIDKVNQLVLSLNQDQLLKPHEEADGQIETFIPEPAMGSEGSSPPVDLQAQNGDPESDGNASTLS
jgi:hypothetical protein